MGFDVVGIGIATVDLNATVSEVPRPDQTVLMLDYRKLRGGPVATALITLQRLGATTAYLGQLGDDEFGRFILAGFKKEGVNVDSLKLVPGESSPFSFILVNGSGKRSIVFNPGCCMDVSSDYVNEAVIKSAKILHIDIGTEAAFAACELLQGTSTKISIDAGGKFPGIEDLLDFAQILILPQEVAQDLGQEQDLTKAGQKLLQEKKKLELVVITRGAEGSIGITRETVISKPAFV